MKKWLAIAVTLTLLAAASAFGQSNQIMDELLAQKPATVGHAAYMVLVASGKASENLSVEEAYDATDWTVLSWMSVAGLQLQPASADSPLTLGTYAQLLLASLDIPGGVMYHLFPGARYAAHEAVFRGFISGDRSPGRVLSGEEALQMLSRALQWKEAHA